jgi:hypothetical protein
MQKCSASLQRSFSDLFPEKKFDAGEMTVVSICQHTKNDMTVWSQDVDVEREELLKNVSTSIVNLRTSQTRKSWYESAQDRSCSEARIQSRRQRDTRRDTKRLKAGFHYVRSLLCLKVKFKLY